MQLPWQTSARQRRALRERRQKKATNPNILRKQIIIGVLIALSIGLILTAVYHVTRVENWQISKIEIVGGTTIPAAQVVTVVEDSLVGSYYRIVPKRFFLLYPQQEITDRIYQIERIKNVKTERTKRQEVTVVFEEYLPTALWCDTPTSTNCLFIDATGYAFTEAPQLDGSAFVRFVDSFVPPAKRTTGFGDDFIATNQEFIALMEKELNLYVTHVNKIGDYDLEYTVAGGGRLKISQTQSLEKSLQNLESILTSPEFEHLQDGSFQYIDLRFGDKVFVNEVTETTSLATTTASSTE